MAKSNSKELLSVRIPAELMREIDGIMGKTNRDKTSVAIELIQRGLDTVNTQPLESENFVSTEKFEAAIANLVKEVEELKKLEAVA